MIIYISGGVRSGKSRYAQDLALKLSIAPVYIATAKIWDEDFEKRVQRHKDERGEQWTTYETYQNLYLLPIQNQTVVIDCVTLWLTNIFMEDESDITKVLKIFKNEIDNLSSLAGTFIIVSNELGMGLHAETALGRKFTDLQGMANQYVAGKADEAIFMVSGLPLYLKK
jgi:adenosylcobinamide kinase/adenosylcobinamide-phosphate guanylyltransferase